MISHPKFSVTLLCFIQLPQVRTSKTNCSLQLLLEVCLAVHLRTQCGRKKLICTNRYTPCHVFLWEGNSVFGHHCFASWCVCGYKHRVVSLQPQHSLFLEDVQIKRPLEQRRARETDQLPQDARPPRKVVSMWWFIGYTEKQGGKCDILKIAHIQKAQTDFISHFKLTGWLVEHPPWKLGWGCVYRNHRRVKLCWQGWPISYFPLGSLLALTSHLFLSLGETRMTQHPEDRGGEPDFRAVNV